MLRISKILIVTFLSSVFITPLLFVFFKIGGAALSGVTHADKNIPFSLNEILAQRFQGFFERNFQKQTGLIGYLVRLDNQIDYFLFNQASSNPRGQIILGLNNQLIERSYLKSANRTIKENRSKLVELVSQLKSFQKSLKKDGTDFILVISPSKAAFYPEAIPSWYKVAGASDRYDSLTFFTEELKKSEVNFIDGFSLLKNKEGELNQPMFAASGTHWNELGGCLVVSEILKESVKNSGKPGPLIECKVSGEMDRPAYQDMDLLRLANFWFPELLIGKAPKIRQNLILSDLGKAPNLLVIGSSFCWELLRQFEQSKAASRIDFLYYFKRHAISSADQGKVIDPATFDYKKITQAKDLVIIEINQNFLNKAGFNFPKMYLNWKSKHND